MQSNLFLKVAVCKSLTHPGQMECQIRSLEGEVLVRQVAPTAYKACKMLGRVIDEVEKDKKAEPPVQGEGSVV